MTVNGQVGSRTVLFSLILLIAPMVAFPHQFGTPLMRMTLEHGLIELAFFVVAAFAMFKSGGISRVLAATAVFAAYRLALGAVLGLLIVVMYPLSFSGALELGLFSYLPAVVLYVIATPFVMGPVIKNSQRTPRRERTIVRENIVRDQAPTGMSSIVISKNRGIVTEANIGRPPTPAEDESKLSAVEDPESAPQTSFQDQSGFEKATRYLGEHGSVFLAAIVDNEGLLLSNFKRGNIVPEDFAPLALLFFDSNRRVLEKGRLSGPEKIDITLKDKRLVVARDQQFSLMVLAERQSDDTLNIRISQAMDMIRRHWAERYTSRQTVNAERIHVSSTE
jgi:hypothetical protein